MRERQALGAHRSERRRCRPPLADRRSSDECRVARAETIGRAPREHRMRHIGSPLDAALDAIRARPSLASRFASLAALPEKPHSWHPAPAFGTEKGPRARCTPQRRPRPGGTPRWGRYRERNWRVALFDAVVGVEDRRMHDRSEPLTGRVRAYSSRSASRRRSDSTPAQGSLFEDAGSAVTSGEALACPRASDTMSPSARRRSLQRRSRFACGAAASSLFTMITSFCLSYAFLSRF